jgi:glycosyltransferase involved in cell wall biosynthesis
VIAISKSTADDLSRLLLVDEAKISPVLLAADRHFRPAGDAKTVELTCEKYGLVSGRYILFVGALEPRKNVPLLLRAYRELVDGGIQERLVIVGRKGWMYGEIFEVLRSLRLEENVVFTGYVPDSKLADLYCGARVFVYPSVYEGFGLPVLEAMSCGTPVVTSNVSSMPEIAGDAAVLVDPRDLRNLTQAIRNVVVDDCLHQTLRRRGLERAAEFSWESTARGTLKVYQEAFGKDR